MNSYQSYHYLPFCLQEDFLLHSVISHQVADRRELFEQYHKLSISSILTISMG